MIKINKIYVIYIIITTSYDIIKKEGRYESFKLKSTEIFL